MVFKILALGGFVTTCHDLLDAIKFYFLYFSRNHILAKVELFLEGFVSVKNFA